MSAHWLEFVGGVCAIAWIAGCFGVCVGFSRTDVPHWKYWL